MHTDITTDGTAPSVRPHRDRGEIEQIVELERLQLHSLGQPCGPAALRRRLDRLGCEPLPSHRTIARILARRGLSHGRTGWYPGDDLPQGATTWPS